MLLVVDIECSCVMICVPNHACASTDKLDGLRVGCKRKRGASETDQCMEDYLQLPDNYSSRECQPGKKRVTVCTSIPVCAP